jgi:hypothetical protein
VDRRLGLKREVDLSTSLLLLLYFSKVPQDVALTCQIFVLTLYRLELVEDFDVIISRCPQLLL